DRAEGTIIDLYTRHNVRFGSSEGASPLDVDCRRGGMPCTPHFLAILLCPGLVGCSKRPAYSLSSCDFIPVLCWSLSIAHALSRRQLWLWAAWLGSDIG